MKKKLLAIVALVATAQACARAPDTTIDLLVDSSDAAVVAETRRILLERFGEYHSPIETRVEGSAIYVTFKHGSPDRELLRYLYSTPGRLRTSLRDLRFRTREQCCSQTWTSRTSASVRASPARRS